MYYINPLYLFEAAGIAIPEDLKTLRNTKKRLLQEFDLADDKSVKFNNITLYKNEIIPFLDELDNPVLLRYHQMIYKERRLCEFLMGIVKHWGLPTKDSLHLRSDGLLEYISPYYAEIYGSLLLEALRNGKHSEVQKAIERPLLVTEEDLENCYQPAHTYINNSIISELKTIEDNLDDKNNHKSEISDIIKKVSKLFQPELLNLLPDYFQEQRNKIGGILRGIAVSLQKNDASNNQCLEIIRLANNLKTDGVTKNRISKDFQTVISNIGIENRNSNENEIRNFKMSKIDREELKGCLASVLGLGALLLIIAIVGWLSDSCNKNSSKEQKSSYNESNKSSSSSNLSERIESYKTRIKNTESEMKSLSNEIERLEPRIGRLKSDIMDYESRSGYLTQSDINDYNFKVEEHNRIIRSYNSKLDLHNKLYKTYSSMIDSANILVEKYNKGRR